MNRLPHKNPSAFWRRLPANLPIAYLLWTISAGLLIADFFFGRILVVSLAELVGLGYWQVSFFDRLAVLLLGLAGATLVILIEHLFRTGVEKGLLWPHFMRVTAWQIGVIVAATVASQLVGD